MEVTRRDGLFLRGSWGLKTMSLTSSHLVDEDCPEIFKSLVILIMRSEDTNSNLEVMVKDLGKLGGQNDH